MTDLVSLLFIVMILLIVKLQIFPYIYICLFTFFVTVIILVNSQAPLQKKEWMMSIIFAGAIPIN